tara:strand:- start:473 stop:643 length:171 start_codon:yes stop_codon:yes gene_type:complete
VEKFGTIGNVFIKLSGKAIEVLVFFWIEEIRDKGGPSLAVSSKVKTLRYFVFKGTK